MKLKYALIPYTLIIVIIQAYLDFVGALFGIPLDTWAWIMDGLMIITAIIGMIAVIIKRKEKFRGWIPLLVLVVFFLLPQLYLYVSMNKSFNILREIYRFALLYITLFIIPLEIHFSRKEICFLIGCFVIYGLISCAYELVQHPRVWEQMKYFSNRSYQVKSFFGQRNRFGTFLALWIILCFLAYELSRKIYWFIPAAIFMFFLVTTESREGLLLACVFILLYIISLRRRLGTWNLLFILVVIMVILALLMIIPVTRDIILSIIDVDRGVTGRDKIWEISWNYYLESNPFFGHGIGVQIEKLMIEQLNMVASTHNIFLYILNSGGICLVIFYIISFAILLRHPCYRHHYLVPLLIAAVPCFGFFSDACIPFEYWSEANMFTICLFFIPAVSGLREHRHHHRHHTKRGEIPIHGPEISMDSDESQRLENNF